MGAMLSRLVAPDVQNGLLMLMDRTELWKGLFSLPTLLIAVLMLCGGFLLYCALTTDISPIITRLGATKMAVKGIQLSHDAEDDICPSINPPPAYNVHIKLITSTMVNIALVEESSSGLLAMAPPMAANEQ